MKREIYDKYSKKHILVFKNISEGEVKNLNPDYDELERKSFYIIIDDLQRMICAFRIYYHQKLAKIMDLKLPPYIQRQGIGSATVTLLENEFKRKGIMKVTGDITYIDIDTAPPFWSAMGYTLNKVHETFYKIEKRLF